MSIEDKFHKLIQTHGQKERDSILEDIYAQMPELAPNSKPVKKRMSLRQKLFISMPIVTVGVCAAIVLPCVLINNTPTHEIIEPTFNYVTANDYRVSNVNNIKEYGEKNNITFEYFDWYAFADYDMANVFTKKSNDKFLAISETLFNTQTNEEIRLFITDKVNLVESLQSIINDCDQKSQIDNISILWGLSNNDINGIIERGEYKYIVTLYSSNDENRLFELVNELLN